MRYSSTCCRAKNYVSQMHKLLVTQWHLHYYDVTLLQTHRDNKSDEPITSSVKCVHLAETKRPSHAITTAIKLHKAVREYIHEFHRRWLLTLQPEALPYQRIFHRTSRCARSCVQSRSDWMHGEMCHKWHALRICTHHCQTSHCNSPYKCVQAHQHPQHSYHGTGQYHYIINLSQNYLQSLTKVN